MRVQSLLLLALAAVMLAGCGSAEDRAARYIERARDYMEEGDLVKARLDLRNAAKIDRGNIEALMLLAEIAERNRNYGVVYRQLERVLEVEPDHVPALVKMATVLLAAASDQDLPEEERQAMVTRARDNVAAALALEPQNADALVLQATLMSRDGDEQGALAQARSVLAENPDNIPGISLMYSIHARQGDMEAALAVVEQGIEDNPDSTSLQLLRLAAYEKLQRWDRVEAGLLQLKEQLPEEPQVVYQLTNFYLARDRLDDAQRVLEDLMGERPDDTSVKLRYAQFLARHRSRAEAETALKAFMTERPDDPQLAFALATLYEAESRPTEAIEIYRSVIDRSEVLEDRTRARTDMAKLLMRDGRLEEAATVLQAALAEDESDPEALILRGSLALNDDRVDEAIADLRTARRVEPDSVRAITLLAQAHLKSGNASLAEERLRDLLDLDAENAFARDQLAALLYRVGGEDRCPDVLRIIEDAAQAGASPSASSVRLQSRCLLADERADEALVQARVLLAGASQEQVEQRRLAHYLAGQALEALDRPEEALVEYRTAESLGDRVPGGELLQALVSVQQKMGRTDAALADLDRALADNGQNVPALLLKGRLLAAERQYERARAVFEQALEVRGDVWETYENLIQVNVALGEPDRAIAVARQAVEVSPQSPRPRVVLAQLLEQSGRFEQAMAAYEEVLALGDNPVAANNLAVLIADHDASPERLAYARELAQPLRARGNPLFLDTAGWVAYRAGDIEEAVSLLERAVRQASRGEDFEAVLPQLRYHLGMAYAADQQVEQARRELTAAVEAGDAFQGIDEARETLSQL